MNTAEKKTADSPGVQFAKAMLESKRQTQKEVLEAYNNPDSEQSKALKELQKRNAERGTPVVYEVQQNRGNLGGEVKSPGVQMAKKMLESQRQTIKEALEEYNDENSEVRKMVDNLIKRNAERGTPIAS